jgi:hypothetical protein
VPSGGAWPAATAERMRVVLVKGMLPALVAVVTWQTVTNVRTGNHFGVVIGEGSISLQDFAWLLNFAKSFWAREAGFSVEDHLRVTEHLAGQRLPFTLPFGYSPTMLWLLGPLGPLPLAWGFVAWTLLGLAAAMWLSQRYRSLAIAAVFITPVAIGSWGLGQTAVLTTVALLALMRLDVAASGAPLSRRDIVVAAALLWALTAKPPLALAAAVALLAGRRLRVVAIGFALAVVSTAIVLPLFGAAGVADYLAILKHYDLETAPRAYAWSLKPETMGNLRALLHVTFGVGDAAATRWSAALWLLTSASILVAAARRAMPIEVHWGLAVLAYLLFCPHVSWTDELQLAVVLAVVPTLTTAPARTRAAVMGFVLVLLFLLPGIPFQGGVRLPLVVFGKLLIAGWLWSRSAASTAQAPST